MNMTNYVANHKEDLPFLKVQNSKNDATLMWFQIPDFYKNLNTSRHGFVAAWGDNRTGPHTWGTYAAKADGLLPTSINAPSVVKLSASLAPVPAHNLLQVQIAETFAQQDICYSIYDLRGACVQETRKLDTKQSMIDVSRLSSGFYLLHLSSGDRAIMLRWMKF